MRVVPGCVAFLFACGLSAQTFVVDAANGPGTNFTSLAVATATVPDGAVLEVRPGNYAPFAIIGKSLTVRGTAGVIVSPSPSVAIAIVGTATHQAVELDGIEIRGELSLTNCAGLVLVQRSGSNATTLSPGALLRAVDCRQVFFRECRFGEPNLGFDIARLERCTATFEECTLVGRGLVLTLTSTAAQFVGSSVLMWAFAGGDAIAMDQSDLRAVRTTISSAFGWAIVGSGSARLEPSCVVTGWGAGAWGGPVQVTRPEMPAVTATGGALGTNVAVAMTGPGGSVGLLGVGLPTAPVASPFANDPQWLLPGTLTVCFVATFASGVPQQFVHTIPNVAAFRGIRLAWQGATVDAVGAVQLSNPAITSHW